MNTAFTHDGPGTSAEDWRAHPGWATVDELALPDDRLVVVAAHPDDESLGAGGLLATAYDAGLRIDVVLLTAGEASHPGSPTLGPTELAETRLAEARQALDLVAPTASLHFLGVGDGAVAEAEDTITTHLVELVGDGRDTLLVAPWRHDGHTDHDAAGRATSTAARRTGARLAEYPVWMWHRAQPDDAPWALMRRLDLAPGTRGRKQRAIQAHATQVRPLSPHPADRVMLTETVLEHFDAPTEHYVVEPAHDDALDRLHRDETDPWGVDERWYERRKRSLTLAALPRPRFARGLEIGCSVGALAADLADRCSELVAVDSSATAVAAAQERLADLPHVRAEHRDVPVEWPAGTFDLVVVSEVGYFLSPRDLDRLVERVAESLPPDGVVVLCHWRHPVGGWVLDGPEVHDRFRRADGLPPEAACYRDRDVEICVLSRSEDWPEPEA